MTTAAVRISPVSTAWALVVAARPKQWVKNLLVYAAPLAAGMLGQQEVRENATLAFVAFVLASSGCYLINDVIDVEGDRLHPHKRMRPIASGRLSVRTALIAAAVLLAATIPLTLATDHISTMLVVLAYIGSVLLYAVWLKRVPGIELLVLAAGFVLRPLAGSAATGVDPSGWFLLFCALAALTIAIGKRQAELARLSGHATAHRSALRGYSLSGLSHAHRLTGLGMVVIYALWGISRPAGQERLFAILTVVPVAIAVIRLGRLNDGGDGDAPETLLFADPWLLLSCVAWLALFVAGVTHA
jgi:decaprenyl-phosphate phosphoribosyltransferase